MRGKNFWKLAVRINNELYHMQDDSIGTCEVPKKYWYIPTLRRNSCVTFSDYNGGELSIIVGADNFERDIIIEYIDKNFKEYTLHVRKHLDGIDVIKGGLFRLFKYSEIKSFLDDKVQKIRG